VNVCSIRLQIQLLADNARVKPSREYLNENACQKLQARSKPEIGFKPGVARPSVVRASTRHPALRGAAQGRRRNSHCFLWIQSAKAAGKNYREAAGHIYPTACLQLRQYLRHERRCRSIYRSSPRPNFVFQSRRTSQRTFYSQPLISRSGWRVCQG